MFVATQRLGDNFMTIVVMLRDCCVVAVVLELGMDCGVRSLPQQRYSVGWRR